MCFYIKEIDTGEQYRVKDFSTARDCVRSLAKDIDEAFNGLQIFGPDAPSLENNYSFLEKCFKE